MAVWELVCTWRRSVAFLARGLCACSLAAVYLFIGLVLCSGHRTARTGSRSDLQVSFREGPAGSSPSSAAEDEPQAVSEATHVGFGAPFNAHRHPHSVGGQPLDSNPQENARSLDIPKIVVQDFSAEDGSVHYKVPEYDPTHILKRRRRSSRARTPAAHGGHLTTAAQPSFRLPPTPGVLPVGVLRPLNLVGGLKHRRSDVFVQQLVFPGRKQAFGDVVAKDGSFVIVGL